MDSSVSISQATADGLHVSRSRFAWGRIVYVLYALALTVSISTWFTAIRAPLWLDETGSFWVIDRGFWQILPRQGTISFPAYYYILWAWTKLFGTSEIAMRFLSVVAMLGAVYLLYLAARELFERDVALIAAVVFCLHPVVIFAAVDIRPYAFAVLATNAAILLVLRLRRSDSYRLAGLLGVVAGMIVWFHYLFAVILPALVVCYFALKRGDGRTKWRQFGVALGAFALTFLPVIPGVLSMFRTRGHHLFARAPRWGDLFRTLIPGAWLLGLLLLTLLALLIVAAYKKRQLGQQNVPSGIQTLVCAALALVPLLIIFGVSAATPLHIFLIFSHQLVAVPGIALCWALMAAHLHFRPLRLIFCVFFVVAANLALIRMPFFTKHATSWKDALQFVENRAKGDNTTVVVCSDFVEANYVAMPLNSAKDSRYFAPLSYYRLSVPVVPLPKALNGEARRIGTAFLEKATKKHERFLAVENKPTYEVLNWLTKRAAAAYSVRKLGTFYGIEVLEFTPRGQRALPSHRS